MKPSRAPGVPKSAGTPLVHLHIRAAYRQRGRARLMREAALAALAQGDLSSSIELTIRLTDDVELHALNKQFRGIDKTTDVLSFGGEDYVDGIRRGERPSTSSGCGRPYNDDFMSLEQLGDVAISMQRCEVQAKEYGHSVEDELALLIIHGVLHLLGYDHNTAARKKRMWQVQARTFELLGRANPLKPGQHHD